MPIAKGKSTPIHLTQYELLTENPYRYGHKELIFEVYVWRQGLSAAEIEAHHDEIWTQLFQKEHPCLRASALSNKHCLSK